jgi:hypothetical protein
MKESISTLLGAIRFDLSIQTICGWCGLILTPGNPDHVSHGMCSVCAEKWA